MIGLELLVVSCCLLAQVEGPAANGPRWDSKRKGQAAPATGTQHRPGKSAYEHTPPHDAKADELMNAVDSVGGMAGEQQTELGQVHGAPRRLRPPELLADALAGPPHGPMPVQAIPLVDVLSRSGDRESQRRTTINYWRLSLAQAQLHYARANLETLHRWNETKHKHSRLTESQLAAAEAAFEDAEFRVLNESEALGLAIGRSDDQRMLSTVDRPHVGDYRTKFDRVFASRTPPARLRLIHRTLPISRRAIDVHGTALVAAYDAINDTEEDYRQGKVEYLTLAGSLDHLVAAQTAFLASVQRYNEDIAEYALYTAPGGFNAAQLAKTLITRPAPPAEARREQPREAPDKFDPAPEGGSAEGEPSHPTFREERGPRQTERDDSSAERRAKIQARLAAFQTPAEGSHQGDYQGLVQAEPARQAQELTRYLHWDHVLPPDLGENIDLASCLERVPAEKRRATLAAYWDTRQQMALYQVFSSWSGSLAALSPKLLAVSSAPGGAAAMVRLQAARQAAQAEVLDQHIRLLSAQFELMRLLDSAPNRPWPLPTTAPHGGNYHVADRGGKVFDSAQENGVGQGETTSLGVAGTRVLLLHSELNQRARALVLADEFRALHAPAEQHQPGEIDGELRAIDRQLRATEAFLATLSNYNLSVADYILPLLPASMPAKGVVKLLVAEPTDT